MEDQELKDIAPNLAKLKNTHKISSVPDNYFETLENKVFQRIIAEDQSVPKDYFKNLEGNILKRINKVPKRKTKKYFPYAIAASIALLISFQINNNWLNTNNFISLSNEEIENWIIKEDINTYDLYVAYNNLSIEDIEITSKIESKEYQDYLYDIDIETLITH